MKVRRSRIAGALALLVLSGAVAAAVLVEVESNDTAATANAADPGVGSFSLVNGTISSATDQDFHSIPLALGERIWVGTDTGGSQGAGATSRDTVIDLIDTDGRTVIETDDDDATGNGGDASTETESASLIAGYAVASAGTYYVRVQGKGGGIVDPYKLFVAKSSDAIGESNVGETESNDTIGAANGPNDGHFHGAITSGEADVFQVRAGAAGRLLFVSLRADVGFDPSVQLLDSAGATLITANSSAAGSAGDPPGESFTYFRPTAGNYFVRVAAANGSSTGGYRLLIAQSAETTFADLSAAIADSADPVMRSAAVNYTVTVSNLSQITDATGVDVTFDGGTGNVVSASGAGWSCTLGPPVGCSLAATLAKNTTDSALTVAMTAPAATGTLGVSASVSADQADDSPLNNDATETTTVSAPSGGGGGGGTLDPFTLLVGLAGLGRWALARRRGLAR